MNRGNGLLVLVARLRRQMRSVTWAFYALYIQPLFTAPAIELPLAVVPSLALVL